MSLRSDLIRALAEARDRAIADGDLAIAPATELPAVGIERPANPDHGDWASNIAMQLAPTARAAPMRIAQAILDHFEAPPAVADAQLAAPGFVNLRLDPRWVSGQVAPILEAGPDYGRATAEPPQRFNVEYVSANPTGPLHVGNARGAFVGDVLSRVLTAAGHEVTREYYFNDFGTQVVNLGLSVLARRHRTELPEDGYRGAYVDELAAELPDDVAAAAEASPDEAGMIAGRWASEEVRAGIEASLARLGVHFDVWKEEGSLHTEGWVGRAVDRLRASGHVYEEEGATWFRSTDFGDDKDRVLIRSTGQPTYFNADAAYYLDKRERGSDRCIYVLGADHHGYVGRLRAIAAAFGDDPDRTVEVVIGQLVQLVRDGEPVRMSKRAGAMVTIEDLVDAVGPDAARYALVRSSIDSTVDIDVGLWVRQTSDNPVFYVQYAHARLSSLQRNATSLGIERGDVQNADLSLLTHEREGDLIRTLGEFPRVVRSAAQLREPHRVARYLEDVASAYHKFYDACRVLQPGDDQANPLTIARLQLCEATRQVLANGLGLLGVSAPEQM